MAHAPPGSRIHPMGPGHTGQRRDHSNQAAGQFDSITQAVAVHLLLLFFSLFSSVFQIGADGPNSMVRRSLGIPTVKWNYDQSAVVAVLHLSEVSITFDICIRYTSLQ